MLRKGGILILTSIPTDRQWIEKTRFLLNVNREDFSCLFVIDYNERTAHYHILDLFHNKDIQELKVWNAELYVLLRDDLERLLIEAGFQQVDFFGDYDFIPYIKEKSQRMIAIAHDS